MTPTLLEMELVAERRAQMLRDAERGRRAQTAQVDHPVARLLIAVGRWLEAVGTGMLVRTSSDVTGGTR